MEARYGRVQWGPGKPRSRTSAAYWKEPLRWNRVFTKHLEDWQRFERSHGANAAFEEYGDCPEHPRVFCGSLCDWLDPEVCAEWRSDLLCLIRATPNLTWMLLSKRPEGFSARLNHVAELDDLGSRIAREWIEGRPPPNIWLGATVEDQQRADERVPELLAIPAKVQFLSCEPLLGEVDLKMMYMVMDRELGPIGEERTEVADKISLIICGGESGPGCRPMDLAWARSLKEQCAAAGCAFWMKQLGGHPNPRHALADLPEDLRTRQLP